MTCIDISIYIFICENYMLIYINIFFNLFHMLHLMFVYKCIVYKVFKYLFLPDASSSTLFFFNSSSVAFSSHVPVGGVVHTFSTS